MILDERLWFYTIPELYLAKPLAYVNLGFKNTDKYKKIQRITITQTQGLILQDYPKPRFLLNLF